MTRHKTKYPGIQMISGIESKYLHDKNGEVLGPTATTMARRAELFDAVSGDMDENRAGGDLQTRDFRDASEMLNTEISTLGFCQTTFLREKAKGPRRNLASAALTNRDHTIIRLMIAWANYIAAMPGVAV